MTLFLLATCKVPHVKIYIKPEQLLNEERGELTSSNEFETIPLNVLFYQILAGFISRGKRRQTQKHYMIRCSFTAICCREWKFISDGTSDIFYRQYSNHDIFNLKPTQSYSNCRCCSFHSSVEEFTKI